MDINKDFKKEIDTYLEKGDISNIAAKADCTPGYVSRVINDGEGSKEVVTEVIKYFAEVIPVRKQEKKELDTMINSTLNENIV